MTSPVNNVCMQAVTVANFKKGAGNCVRLTNYKVVFRLTVCKLNASKQI